jgi:hypothetical protein
VFKSAHNLTHQNSSKAGRTVFHVARCTEGLPHQGTGLQVLPELQSLTTHLLQWVILHCWQSVFYIDLIGPLHTSEGYTCCLTAVNHLTCWPVVMSILDSTAAANSSWQASLQLTLLRAHRHSYDWYHNFLPCNMFRLVWSSSNGYSKYTVYYNVWCMMTPIETFSGVEINTVLKR